MALPSDPKLAGRYKYSPTREKKILNRIREGEPPTIACQLEGISKTSLKRWKDDSPEFVERMEQAEAEFHAKLVKIVSSSDSPQDAKWLLERRFPEDYREQKQIKITDLTDEQILRYLALAAEDGGDTAGANPDRAAED